MEAQRPVGLETLLAQRDWVRRVARTLVRDEAAADDLEQQAWVDALRSPPPRDTGIRGWFATVLRRRARDAWRSGARRERREEAAAKPEALRSTAEVVAEADTHRRVVDAVMALEEPFREVMLLRYFEDLTPLEVARRTGVPLDTARSRLRRAVARLKERLDHGTGGDRAAWMSSLVSLSGFRPEAGVSALAGVAAASTASTAGPAAGLVGGALMGTKVAVGVGAALTGAGILIGSTLLSGGTSSRELEAARADAQELRARIATLEAAPTQGPRLDGRLASQDREIRELKAALAAATVPAKAAVPAAPPSAPPSAPPAAPPAAPSRERSRRPADVVAAGADGWKADILQIEDPRRRERGLDALEAALHSPEAAVATGALRGLYDIRDIPYEKRRFRDAVLSRLDDENPQVRGAAASALMNVQPEDRDVDLLLDAAERHPEDGSQTLVVAAWLSKRRVEGRLAGLFVRALAAEDPRTAVSTANMLRSMWVTAEVEDAVLAAWRRTKDDPAGGLWNHILGQITPTREPRVRVIFEILKADRTDAPQLLNRALEPQNLDPSAKPAAVQLALEALPAAPNAMILRLMLDVVRKSGTVENAPALRAFAANTMVGEESRRAASEAADEMQKRR